MRSSLWGNLVVRADTGPAVGTGHAMRCLALAQAWIEHGGEARFLLSAGAPVVERRLLAEGIPFSLAPGDTGSEADARATAGAAREVEAEWVVADGYQFGGPFQKTLQASGARLLLIDDHGRSGANLGDLILDQNAGARAEDYTERRQDSRLLLGPRFALLRREFQKAEPRAKIATGPPPSVNLLITPGGMDRAGFAVRGLEAVARCDADGLSVRVLLGASQNPGEKRSRVEDARALQVEFDREVLDMAKWMAWADVALSAAGSTALELARMGVPALLVSVADNQRRVAAAIQDAGAGIDLGWHEDASPEMIARALKQLVDDPEVRSRMRDAGMRLVDGNGTLRVVDVMHARSLRLRPVRPDDASVVWGWANDPEARRQSFSQEQIPWDEHVRWFGSKLSDSGCRFYIAETPGGVPIGQVRFDVEGEESVISVSVGRDYRGHGLGSEVVRMGCEIAAGDRTVGFVRAFIRPGNVASRRTFQDAGFKEDGSSEVRGQRAVVMTLRRVD